MLKEILQLSALVLTLESAFFISKGNIGLSVRDIAELSSTKFGANFSVTRSLAFQNVDNWIGMILLIISFFLQMAVLLFKDESTFLFQLPTILITLFLNSLVFYVFLVLQRKVG